MSKVTIIFGNITFDHFGEEELALFKTGNERKALIHKVDKVWTCDEADVDQAIYDYETEAWLIPTEFNGEVVYEPSPDKTIEEVIAEN